jgi:phage terminase Nu1 subunit (DNA packaging protein)
MFTKVGAAAAEASNNEGGAKESPIVSFKSGTTLKVGVKSVNDVAEYYGYGIYKKVNTFVPKNPAVRNSRGFIDSAPSVWDRAADTLYADAKKAEEAGASQTEIDAIKDEAYLFRGKKRYLRAFFDLATGKDVVVDLSPKQETQIKAVIEKYAKKLGTIAFELGKTGTSTNAAVALSPIIDMDEDLTDAERANYAKLSEAPFDLESFETCLYVADDAEQTKNLVIAGFDIGRLGLSIGAAAATSATQTEDVTPIAFEVNPDMLPF